MPIPDYQPCFRRPVLALAAQSPITRASATQAVADEFLTANLLPPSRWAIARQRLSDVLLPTLLAGFAVAGLTSCVKPSTRRIHAENMTKAEAFKHKFERDIPPGTSFEDVAAYLKGQGLQLGLTAGPENHYVELLREKSPNWFCGVGSVGLVVHFRDNKLDRAETGSWSFDCP